MPATCRRRLTTEPSGRAIHAAIRECLEEEFVATIHMRLSVARTRSWEIINSLRTPGPSALLRDGSLLSVEKR